MWPVSYRRLDQKEFYWSAIDGEHVLSGRHRNLTISAGGDWGPGAARRYDYAISSAIDMALDKQPRVETFVCDCVI